MRTMKRGSVSKRKREIRGTSVPGREISINKGPEHRAESQWGWSSGRGWRWCDSDYRGPGRLH